MAAQVFAFIVHKDGAADDSALELISAARNMFPDASPDRHSHRRGRRPGRRVPGGGRLLPAGLEV